MSEKKLKIALFLSVLFSCLLLVNWHYDFDFTTGTPFNIRAFVFNMFFKREINLDHYWNSAGIDLAYSPNGHIYSGYPPGAAWVTLPFFVVEQIIAFLHVRLLGPMNGTIAWWLESVFIALPSVLAIAVSAVLLFDLLRRFGLGEGVAIFTAWAFVFTSFIFAYSGVIHYQPLAMFWVFVSLWIILNRPLGFVNLAGAGFSLGMAALTEYVTILYLIPILFYLVKVVLEVGNRTNYDTVQYQSKGGFRPLPLLVFLGGLGVPLTALAVYNWHSFGAPWLFSHQFVGREVKKGLVFGLRPWEGFFGLYFSPLRGLLFHAPLVIFAPLGIAKFYRQRKCETLMLLGGVTLVTLIYSFWKEWWAGWNYGPRFLISTLPIWFFFVGFGIRKSFVVYLLTFYSFILANAAALTGIREITKKIEVGRMIPWERLQKFFGALSHLDSRKLSPFIFRFHHELPLLSSLSPLILYSLFFILLLAVEFLPLVFLLKEDRQ